MNINYYIEIKNEIINNEIIKKVKDYSKNKSDLNTYYNVGKLLYSAGKHYGEGIIKEYSKRLSIDLNKKYSVRLLYKMIKYYKFLQKEKVPTVSAKLTWSHYDEILKLNDRVEINYYIKTSIENNLSVRELRQRIKNKEYERLPKETRDKLITNEKQEVQDLIKNPILIKNKYNYIDLLLYNIEFNCYVVIELKVTKLKKEHIGQIQVYMNYIDNNLRNINQDKTIGIIICRKNNKFVMEYCSDKRVLSKEYKLI